MISFYCGGHYFLCRHGFLGGGVPYIYIYIYIYIRTLSEALNLRFRLSITNPLALWCCQVQDFSVQFRNPHINYLGCPVMVPLRCPSPQLGEWPHILHLMLRTDAVSCDADHIHENMPCPQCLLSTVYFVSLSGVYRESQVEKLHACIFLGCCKSLNSPQTPSLASA